MKTLIKIVIAILVVTVSFNAARAAVNNYQFEDALKEMLLFDPRASDVVLVDKTMKLANAYDLPIDPKDINIRQVGSDVHITMSYTQDVMLIPGFYSREWTFTPAASTKILTGSRAQP